MMISEKEAIILGAVSIHGPQILAFEYHSSPRGTVTP